ncbi:hypothetical protein [Sulfuricurvum sp.]|uniref:hypothetical protein n=1 Tax=Sulfuricurvum sp. TaxID=2025608 RepID=UPI003BAE9F35
MKKYSIIALFILVLITIAVSTYFFFLNIVHDNKVVNEEVQALQTLKNAVNIPLVEYISANELKAKQESYSMFLDELGIKGTCRVEKEYLVIDGVIENSTSYILLKRLLAVIKSDNVTMQSSCIGKGCGPHPYGYKITIRPYRLNFSK